MENVDLTDLWAVWRHGWKCGRLARDAQPATVYLPKPGECSVYGGPCVKRGECQRIKDA